MSDYVPDSGIVGRLVCPGCEGGGEVSSPSEIVTVRWCEPHQPAALGEDDAKVGSTRFLSGTGEADGADCRAVQAMITRHDRSEDNATA